MPKRIHLIAGFLSPLLIATFFTSTADRANPSKDGLTREPK